MNEQKLISDEQLLAAFNKGESVIDGLHEVCNLVKQPSNSSDKKAIIADIVWANIYFKWSQESKGFGEWSCVIQNGEVKDLSNEGMGPIWSRQALNAFSDALIKDLFTKNGTPKTTAQLEAEGYIVTNDTSRSVT